jgi:hypothetical protein
MQQEESNNTMSSLRIIYQITLPERMIGETFIEFMRDEYFPAVHKGPTRVGQVTSLSLLRVSDGIKTNTFFMQISYNGLATFEIRVDDKEVQQKFETLYGKRMKRLGSYYEVAAWSEKQAA